MRKIAFLAVLALVAVPAAFADNAGQTDRASTLCKQQQTGIGAPAFKLLYGEHPPRRSDERCQAVRGRACRCLVPDHARRRDVRPVLRDGQERQQRLRQVRLEQGEDARAAAPAGHD